MPDNCARDRVLSEIYLIEQIINFLSLKDRISSCSQVCKVWFCASEQPSCWKIVDLRWFNAWYLWYSFPQVCANCEGHKTKIIQDKKKQSIQTYSNTFKYPRLDIVSYSLSRLGPWSKRHRLYVLQSLKINNVPKGNVAAFLKALTPHDVPYLKSLEIYWVNPSTGTTVISIPPFIDDIIKREKKPGQEQPNSITTSFQGLALHTIIIDFPMSDVDIQGLIPHIHYVKILVLSRLSPSSAEPHLSFILWMFIAEAINHIHLNQLHCLCLKETLDRSYFTPHLENWDTNLITNQSLDNTNSDCHCRPDFKYTVDDWETKDSYSYDNTNQEHCHIMELQDCHDASQIDQPTHYLCNDSVKTFLNTNKPSMKEREPETLTLTHEANHTPTFTDTRFEKKQSTNTIDDHMTSAFPFKNNNNGHSHDLDNASFHNHHVTHQPYTYINQAGINARYYRDCYLKTFIPEWKSQSLHLIQTPQIKQKNSGTINHKKKNISRTSIGRHINEVANARGRFSSLRQPSYDLVRREKRRRIQNGRHSSRNAICRLPQFEDTKNDEIQDYILKLIIENQCHSIQYLVAPDLHISYTTFSSFIQQCKNIQLWDLTGWRHFYNSTTESAIRH